MGDNEAVKEDSDFKNEATDEPQITGSDKDFQNASDRCNLIVNYLPPDFDDNNLKTLFSEHGDISVAKVIKDKNTKKSLGYGFVKFSRSDDTMDAIERKNGMMLGDKKIKVSLARPSTEDIRNCKLYITNLPKDYVDEDIFKLFSQFGEIIECRVLQDRQTKSNRGVSFVQFSNRNEANNALCLNGYRINDSDRTLVVKYAENQQKKKEKKFVYDIALPVQMNSYNNASIKTVYEMDDPYYYDNIARIPPNAATTPYAMGGPGYFYESNDMQRRNYYNKGTNSMNPQLVNSPQSIRQPDDHHWYQQTMPIHVGYDNRSSPAFNNMNAHYGAMPEVSGPSTIGHSVMKSPHQDQYGQGTVTLVILNLPSHADVASLHDLLSPYGRIVNAQIDVAAGGICSGRGQVQMANLLQAQYAIQALSGTILSEAGQPLQIFLYGGHGQAQGHNPERFQHYNHNLTYHR